MPQERTRKLVISGVMGAITILLGVTHWGFIPWGAVSLTIMPVPVIIAAILEGPIVGLGVGLIFGIFSMIQGAIAPFSAADTWFTNPILAILPRLFIGPVAYFIWKLLDKIPEIKIRIKRIGFTISGPILALIVGGMVGSLTNTVLVLGVIGLLELLPWAMLPLIFVSNGLLEAGVSAFIVLVVVAAWRQIRIGKRQGSDL